jgi:hypothetical protein
LIGSYGVLRQGCVRGEAARDDQQGIAVRRCFRDELDSGDPAAARPIVDDELLAETCGEARCERARDDIGSAVRRKRADADIAHTAKPPRQTERPFWLQPKGWHDFSPSSASCS